MKFFELDNVQRWDEKNKKYITVERPEVIKLYNQSMGGVDNIDQLIAYYRIFIRSKKSRGLSIANTTSSPSPIIQNEKAAARRPYDETRYDNIARMPSSGLKLRCKKQGCNAKYILFEKMQC